MQNLGQKFFKFNEENRLEKAKKIYDMAHNNGVQCEAMAIAMFDTSLYSPQKQGKDGGDIFCKEYGNLQVKFMNGSIETPEDTKNLFNDVITALEKDGSDFWQIWLTKKEFVIVPKATLFIMAEKYVDDFFVMDYDNITKKSKLRVKCGRGKRVLLKSLYLKIHESDIEEILQGL